MNPVNLIACQCAPASEIWYFQPNIQPATLYFLNPVSRNGQPVILSLKEVVVVVVVVFVVVVVVVGGGGGGVASPCYGW